MRQWIAVLVCGTVVSVSVGLSPPPPPAAQCGAWEKGVSLNGHDITFQVVPSAAECCELCGRCVEVHFVSACRAASVISVGSTLPLWSVPMRHGLYACGSLHSTAIWTSVVVRRTVGAAACTGWTWNINGQRCYLKNGVVSNTSGRPRAHVHTRARNI
jgi:hypothetical protein